MMALPALLKGYAAGPVPDMVVRGLQSDSRRVQPGDLFAAVPGLGSDGADYLMPAARAGAVAAIWDGVARPAGVDLPLVQVPGLRSQLGPIASRLHGEPSAQLCVVGITGTDGKTSCAHLLAQALDALGLRCGYVGTLGIGFTPALDEATHTTPAADALQSALADLLAQGARAVGMEVSSHALDQHRVAGCQFDTAVLTNLGRDHLDYHGSLEAYARAKRRLFDMPGLKALVLNTDDATGRQWAGEYAGRGAAAELLVYGLSRPSLDSAACLFAETVERQPDGLRLVMNGAWGRFEVVSSLLGRFNAYNLTAVLAVLLRRGHSVADVTRVAAALTPVPGRMQRVPGPGTGPAVVVDYAHTPGALEAALEAARGHARGRLICVFGCGGDRDRGKRPLMAAAAESGADAVWVTSDNPRGEAPDAIIADILAGLASQSAVSVRVDRAQAIRAAIESAGADDLVLIAGKGHETYQIVGDSRHHFDDREAALHALAGR